MGLTERIKPLGTEFVVVVLGVLVALAADSAMDDYRERQDAQNLLAALRDDLVADKEQLEDVWLPRLSRYSDARTRLQAFVEGDSPITMPTQFVTDVWRAATYTTLDPNRSAIDDLVNSSGLGLIRNRELRSQILDYRRQLDNIIEFDAVHRAFHLQIQRDLATGIVGGFALSASFADAISGGPERITEAEARAALNEDEIRAADDLRVLLVSTSQPHGIQRYAYGQLYDIGTSLIAALDEELGLE